MNAFVRRLLTGVGLAAIAPVFTAVSSGAPVFGQLQLINGDRLQVAIEGYDDARNTLRVRHPFAQEPFDLLTTALTRFTAAESAPAQAVSAGWLVSLANGDQIRGDELSLADGKLRMRSSLLGEITAPRAALASLTRSAAMKTIYDGPRKNDEWVRGRQKMKLNEDKLTVAIAEPVGINVRELPRRARIDVEVRWSFPNFFISFYTRSALAVWEGTTSGYQLIYQMGNNVILNRLTPGVGINQIGVANLPKSARRSASMSFFFDLDGRRIALMMGERLIADWKEPSPPADTGTVISFLTHNADIEVLKLRVSEWDGVLPGADPGRGPGDADSILLSNGDNLTGTLEKIANNVATVKSPFGELPIPIGNISRVALKTDAPAAKAEGVRLALSDGTNLTLVIRRISEGVVHGEHRWLGPVRVPLAAVRQAVWPNTPVRRVEDEEEDSAAAIGDHIAQIIGGVSEQGELVQDAGINVDGE